MTADILRKLAANKRPASRWGIGTAGAYLRQLDPKQGLLDAEALRKADNTLVYSDENMAIEKSAAPSMTPGSILEFEAIVTSGRADRDGDVLEPAGAKVDPAAPLLWQHNAAEPIGKLLAVTEQNDKHVKARFAIADTPLGHDAKTLLEFGSLRISHGFLPLEYDELTDKAGNWAGWHVKSYDLMEISLVSIPSNQDAIITAFNTNKFHHVLTKSWAGSLPQGDSNSQTTEPGGQDMATTKSVGGELPQTTLDELHAGINKLVHNEVSRALPPESKSKAGVDPNAFIASSAKSQPNVIPGRERFDTTKAVGKHARLGVQIASPRGGFALEPSELELAKLCCYFKFVASRAGVEQPWNEVEKSLLGDILKRDTWVGLDGGEFTRRIGHPRMLTKSDLLSDATSGGDYLVPEWFDTMLVHDHLLTGELYPYVTIREMGHGDTVKGAAVDNPTITSGLSDGTPATAFDCTSLVSELTATVFDAGCYIKVSNDLMQDAVVDIGRDLYTLLGQAWLGWIEEQIAVGDGTSEPQGLFVAGGVTSVSATNGTSGPASVSDAENLMFGVAKQYRVPSQGCCYVMNDLLYKKFRALQVGASDYRRIFGMNHMDYTLLSWPVRINNSISNGSAAFVRLRDYRLWKRPGPVLKIETGGQTLALANESLVYLRGRLAGKLVNGSAMASCTDLPTSIV